MPTWDDVRELAATLPESDEGTLYGRLALRVRKKAFAWFSPQENDALVLRCDHEERPLMIESRPDVFWVTPHYEDYPMVLVHLDAIGRDELLDRVTESWLIAAPPLLAARRRERE